MTHRVVTRPAAKRDIEECFVYIAEDNLDIGMRFLVAVEDTLERLGQFPYLGKTKDFLNRELPTIRVWPVKGFDSYLIFYVVKDESVDVVRVLHGSRNIEDIFG